MIFKWETLSEIGGYSLNYESPIPGTRLYLESVGGSKIEVWRAENGKEYFCHGLTFGGKEAPGGPISPFGNHVPTILREFYQLIPEEQAQPGDVLVWRGLDANDVVHSAVLTAAVMTPGKPYLHYAARLQSKNGMRPEANMTLEELVLEYGESYNTFRLK